MVRIDEFKSLQPEATLVYIGWNALYREEGVFHSFEDYVYTARLLNGTFTKLYGLFAPYSAALSAFAEDKAPDPSAAELEQLENYVPSFLGVVEELIIQMKDGGSYVVVLTLPGLFTMEEVPSEKALKIGHLPVFTNNPYEFVLDSVQLVEEGQAPMGKHIARQLYDFLKSIPRH